MSDHGVLYMVWGEAHERLLRRSIASLGNFHPDLPVRVHRLDEGELLDKAGMFDLTPFDTTLFLDTDTVVLGNLDFAFDRAERHGLACCICEEPWARRYPSIKGDVIEYNTGVLCFTKEAKPVFDRWKALARDIDSSIRFDAGKQHGVITMPSNDQAGFAAAVHELDFNPFVLPLNFNFRPIWHKSIWGEMKIWHDYREPPRMIHTWNQEQSLDGAIIKYAEFR